MVDQAEIADISITVNGRTEPATAITLLPYQRNPGIERYAAFRDKRYRFVLSPAVPGRIYEIKASLPANPAGAEAVIDRVTYKSMRE